MQDGYDNDARWDDQVNALQIELYGENRDDYAAN